MAITDINISDTLETSAPSIRYSGNEGPKSPEEQQQMMMAQLEEEYAKYVFEMEEQGLQPMSIQQFMEQAMTEGRQGVAHGGIMGLDGRKRYGWGSKIKERLRKLIPNELATAARVAAPFVAPFNPLIGGAMAGLGGFDKHGSISKGLKSGLLTYGGGQLARGIGGAGPQWGLKAQGTGSGLGSYFTSPMSGNQLWGAQSEITGASGADKAAFMSKKPYTDPGGGAIDAGTDWSTKVAGGDFNIEKGIKQGTPGIMDFIDKNAKYILLGSMGIAAATADSQDMKAAVNATRGTKLDIDAIRAEVQEAFEAGEDAWNELKKKYPYIGGFSTKKAEGGRIGYYSGGQSTPSDYTMEDARKTSMQDKMGGITEVMKQADLFRQGDVGQFYAADGGRIGYRHGKNYKSNQGSNEMKFNMDAKIKYLKEMGASDKEIFDIIVKGKDISDQYKTLGGLEGERRAEPFYPDRFEGERRAEPFYPDRFEGRLEPMAQGGRIRYADGRAGYPPVTMVQSLRLLYNLFPCHLDP